MICFARLGYWVSGCERVAVCLGRWGEDRTVRPRRHRLPTVTGVSQMDGTGSVKRAVRATALRRPRQGC